MKISFLKPKEKKEYFLGLDLGSEAVKGLIFQKMDEKRIILGAALQYYDPAGVWDSVDFDKDVLKKAIRKVLQEIQREVKTKPNLILINLPPDVLKARIAFQSFQRKNPNQRITNKEKNVIFQRVFKDAQKEISQIFSKDFGILPEDLQFIEFKILEIKIDGYEVSSLDDFNGKNLDFRILITFSPKHYFKNFQKLFSEINLKILRVIHPTYGLMETLKDKVFDALFFDIGGDFTKIFLIRKGKLEWIDEFKLGGKIFSQALSRILGLNEGQARILKEKYSKGLLSEPVRKRIKEEFWSMSQEWCKILKERLKTIQVWLPSEIFLLGGGSLIPEIQEILIKGDWTTFSFSEKPKIKILYPKDLKNFEDRTKILNTPQFISTLWLSYV